MTEDSTFYTMDDFDNSIHELLADLQKESDLAIQALRSDVSPSVKNALYLKHSEAREEIRVQFRSRTYT